MNEEVKAKWLAALRSGEFEQGQNFLRYGDQYCCLGVLCELAVREGVITETDRGFDMHRYANAAYDLPYSVLDWSGLETCDPVPQGHEINLSAYNDQEHKTFAEIADIIEAGL